MEFLKTKESNLELIMFYEAKAAKKAYVIAWTKAQHIEAINRTYHKVIVKDSRIVGYLIMNKDDDNLELMRIVIFEPNQGYGREAIEKVKALAFHDLKCHRLWLDVRMHNKWAIELYKKLDFVQEGILREAVKYKDGYLSVMIMAILREDYV